MIDRLASMRIFPALVMAFCFAAAVCVGILEGPLQ